MKTVDDYNDFDDFYKTRIALRGLNMRLRDGEDSSGILRRMFLRAWVKSLWGIEKDMTHKSMAHWLTDRGYPTTLSDVSNAARKEATPVFNVVPKTQKVTELMTILLASYSDMVMDNFLQK